MSVRINRTSISVVSHPGPDPSVPAEDIKSGRMVSRRYRNRRIGEFLKELEFTEGRGTGVPKMRRALKSNGSAEPVFFTDSERLSFWSEIKIHPEFLEHHIPPVAHVGVYEGVHDLSLNSLSQTEVRLLNLIKNQPLNSAQILKDFGYKVITRNIREALDRLLEQNLAAYTIPDKPRSKRQQYKITSQGKRILEQKH